MESLQLEEETREGWINYSAFDAKATYELYTALKEKLQMQHWVMDQTDQKYFNIQPGQTLFDFYNKFWRPFGELLTDMEKTGFLVNRSVAACHQAFSVVNSPQICTLKLRPYLPN